MTQEQEQPVTEEEVGDLVKNLHEQGMTELDTFIQDEEDGRKTKTISG